MPLFQLNCQPRQRVFHQSNLHIIAGQRPETMDRMPQDEAGLQPVKTEQIAEECSANQVSQNVDCKQHVLIEQLEQLSLLRIEQYIYREGVLHCRMNHSDSVLDVVLRA